MIVTPRTARTDSFFMAQGCRVGHEPSGKSGDRVARPAPAPNESRLCEHVDDPAGSRRSSAVRANDKPRFIGLKPIANSAYQSLWTFRTGYGNSTQHRNSCCGLSFRRTRLQMIPGCTNVGVTPIPGKDQRHRGDPVD